MVGPLDKLQLKWLTACVISVIGAHPAGVYSGIVIEQR